MFGMFWIALELGNPKMGLNVILSLLVKKLSAFKNDEVAKSGNTGARQYVLLDALKPFPENSL